MQRKFSLKDCLIDRFEQIVQLFALVGGICTPFRFNFKAVVEQKQPGMNIQELVTYYALRHGNVCIAFIIAVLMITMFHKINDGKVLNKGNRYHQRKMFEYWICSNILGYRKCSLIRVPIADQFKLVLSDMFTGYDFGSYEKTDDEENVSVRKFGTPMHSALLQQNIVVNDSEIKIEADIVFIAISDTYPITDEMLPDNCNEHNTVIIQREFNKEDSKRYESKALVKRVLNFIKHIDGELVINILPTTNPINTFNIVNEVFKTGGQDNIKHLYVYFQPHKTVDDRKFSNRGIKIF